MFITADQVLAHAVGDYIIQSDWMADNKTRKSLAAGVHAVTYTLPFLFLTQAPLALAFIAGTHFLIDRSCGSRTATCFSSQSLRQATSTTSLRSSPSGFSS